MKELTKAERFKQYFEGVKEHPSLVYASFVGISESIIKDSSMSDSEKIADMKLLIKALDNHNKKTLEEMKK
jgi:hypothetical protein